MTLTFAWTRHFKTAPLLPYHPTSHASRALIHRNAIKHLHKREQPLMSTLRTRLGKSSKHLLLRSSDAAFKEAFTSILDAFNTNLTPRLALFESLWQSARSMGDVMLGMAVMRLARYLNLPNRSAVLCEFIKTITRMDKSPLGVQEGEDPQWTPTDIVAYACQERIAFLDEELLGTFITHCKSPLDALSMLAYAWNTHNVLLRSEDVNSLFHKLVECHKKESTDHKDLLWTAITKLVTCSEIREDVLLHFLVDCSEEQREELLRDQLPTTSNTLQLCMEYLRGNVSIDALEGVVAGDPVTKNLLDRLLLKATLGTSSTL